MHMEATLNLFDDQNKKDRSLLRFHQNMLTQQFLNFFILF